MRTEHTIKLSALQLRRNHIAMSIDTPSDAWEETVEIAAINALIKPMLTRYGDDKAMEVTTRIEHRTRAQNKLDEVIGPDSDPLPVGWFVYIVYNGDTDENNAGGPDGQPTGPFATVAEAMLFADDMEDAKPIAERNAERKRIEDTAVAKARKG